MNLYIFEVHLGLYTRLPVCGKLMEYCWSWWGFWCCSEQRVPLISQQVDPLAAITAPSCWSVYSWLC